MKKTTSQTVIGLTGPQGQPWHERWITPNDIRWRHFLKFAGPEDKRRFYIALVMGLLQGILMAFPIILSFKLIAKIVAIKKPAGIQPGDDGNYSNSTSINVDTEYFKIHLDKDPVTGLPIGSGRYEFKVSDYLENEANDILPRIWESILWIFCILMVCLTITNMASTYFLRVMVENQAFLWRKLYFGSVLKLDLGWFDSQDALSIPTKLNDDIGSIVDVMGTKALMGFSSVFMIFGGLGYAIYCFPPTIFIAIPMFLIVGIGFWAILKGNNLSEAKQNVSYSIM